MRILDLLGVHVAVFFVWIVERIDQRNILEGAALETISRFDMMQISDLMSREVSAYPAILLNESAIMNLILLRILKLRIWLFIAILQNLVLLRITVTFCDEVSAHHLLLLLYSRWIIISIRSTMLNVIVIG